jgi:tRNA (uracil-5-)-methyltransferase TRM9
MNDFPGKNDSSTFDRIAPGWYGFRHRSIFSHELEELAGRWRKGTLLNIGCAHGPDFIPFIDKFELHGLDFSGEMIKLALRYSRKFKFSVNLITADARYLPYDDNSFDWVIAVATYHHLREKEERTLALKELKRILKPGGEAFITVWNRYQTRFLLKGRDTAVPWKSTNGILYRYYHLFSYGELEHLVKKAGFHILRSYPESSYHLPLKIFSRNICLLVKKDDIE